jgi:hypothetical protein
MRLRQSSCAGLHSRGCDWLRKAVRYVPLVCPRVVYTDLNSLRLLAVFGEAGRRAYARGRCGLEAVLRARARTIGDHQAALSRHAALVDVQALVRPPGERVGPADQAGLGHTCAGSASSAD